MLKGVSYEEGSSSYCKDFQEGGTWFLYAPCSPILLKSLQDKKKSLLHRKKKAHTRRVEQYAFKIFDKAARAVCAFWLVRDT